MSRLTHSSLKFQKGPKLVGTLYPELQGKTDIEEGTENGSHASSLLNGELTRALVANTDFQTQSRPVERECGAFPGLGSEAQLSVTHYIFTHFLRRER